YDRLLRILSSDEEEEKTQALLHQRQKHRLRERCQMIRSVVRVILRQVLISGRDSPNLLGRKTLQMQEWKCFLHQIHIQFHIQIGIESRSEREGGFLQF